MGKITINFYNKTGYKLIEKIDDLPEISEKELDELKERVEKENKCKTFYRIQKN